MTAPVVDTLQWSLVVPLCERIDLTGSVLTATMTPSRGGPPAVSGLTSVGATDAQGIVWINNDDGLAEAIRLEIPPAARNGWLASAPTTLVFDVAREVPGSTRHEWLGRTSCVVMPASNSPSVAASQRSVPILVPPPGGQSTLTTLPVGLQGAKGDTGDVTPAAIDARDRAETAARNALRDAGLAQEAAAQLVVGFTASGGTRKRSIFERFGDKVDTLEFLNADGVENGQASLNAIASEVMNRGERR